MKTHTLLKSLLIAHALLLQHTTSSLAVGLGEPLPGEKEFPIIIYSVNDTAEDFQKVKNWGATHVHTYGMGIDIVQDQSFFDLAQEQQLKVMANLNGGYRFKKGLGLEDLQAYANHFKDHPALGIWYLYDEPDGSHEPEELQPFYEALKNMTPKVMVANAHAWTKGWHRYSKAQDVLMNDIYPVTGAPFPEANLFQQTEFTRNALKYSNVVIPVIQMMNWRVFAPSGETELKDYLVDELRYPTQSELRYMTFSSIAMGAQGVSYFSYHRSKVPDRNWGDHTFGPMVKEVSEFFKAIGYPNYQFHQQGPSGDLIVGLWETEQHYWIIAANASGIPLQAAHSFSGGPKNAILEAWGNTRNSNATLRDHILSVNAEPWEVFIWNQKK